ncbi:hypothetical protein OC861_005615 [Tilletia horrida]|nr:hypothetical protein OC861_005615 [Tilletia horrida]
MAEESHVASLEEANAARLPIGWRDNCSALLIPLNKCRHKTLYAPWKCEDESFIRRQRQLSKQKLAAASEE